MYNQNIVICWVPGHRGIKGNVAADENATSVAFNETDMNKPIPATELKPLLRHKLRKYWQDQWDNAVVNKLHVIKPKLGNWISERTARYKEVLLCRLRIGHTYATHSYLLTGSEPPTCTKCGNRLTVIHVLIQCTEIEAERKKYFPSAYLQHIPLHPAFFLSNEPLFTFQTVLNFLTETDTLHVIWPGYL